MPMLAWAPWAMDAHTWIFATHQCRLHPLSLPSPLTNLSQTWYLLLQLRHQHRAEPNNSSLLMANVQTMSLSLTSFHMVSIQPTIHLGLISKLTTFFPLSYLVSLVSCCDMNFGSNSLMNNGCSYIDVCNTPMPTSPTATPEPSLPPATPAPTPCDAQVFFYSGNKCTNDVFVAGAFVYSES